MEKTPRTRNERARAQADFGPGGETHPAAYFRNDHLAKQLHRGRCAGVTSYRVEYGHSRPHQRCSVGLITECSRHTPSSSRRDISGQRDTYPWTYV